jgi:lipopolysaccharide cholinephosphotransferase
MKTELSLPEIKTIAFDILKHFALFCEQNGIRFYLSNGTLLGAVKYGGFIPWDDDIDVFVPRGDYDRLIKIYENSEQYHLFSRERDLDFRFPFAKLCDMTTLKVEMNINNGVQLGVDIDIFPLDSCSKNILRPNTQRMLRIYQAGCILSKITSFKEKPIYKRAMIVCCRLLGFKFFCNNLTNVIMRDKNRGNEFKGCLAWPIYGEREFVPAEVFSEIIMVEFESEKFPAPIGYDVYLRSLYGDYKKDPPVNNQVSHHKYTAYRLK